MEQQPEGDILDAVQCGDIATVKKFLDEGVPVDLTDEEGWSLLHHAAALGQIKVINLLRERGCRVDLIDNEGHTPLHYAATNGDIETIRLLIAMGSNVNSVDNKGNTPLKWSVMCEQNAAIEELTKHGGTVEIKEMESSADNRDRPALRLPFQDPGHILGNGNNEVCQSNPTELFNDIQHVSTAAKSNDSYQHSDHNSHQTDLVTTQQCMDTNADTTQLEGDIFEAAQCGDTATVKRYLDIGVPVDVTDEDGWSPVHHAIAYRQVEVIRLLIDRGCLMNSVKSKKYFSKEKNRVTHTSEATIFEAAQSGDTVTVKGYLDLGLPIDVTDEDGWSPVHHALAHHQVEVIRLLMDRGCLMNPVKNSKQATKSSALCITTEGGSEYSPEKWLYDDVFEAARCGDIAIIQSYLNSGGPVDLTDEDGRTLLHCAASEGQIKVVGLLIKRGCCIDQVDKNGWTPLDYATACGHVQTVQLLKQQLNEPCEEQFFIDSVDSRGRSVLHIAAQCGYIHIIKMLAEQGLDVNRGDGEGWTSLHYAAAYGQLESVRTLLRLGGRESMTKVAGIGGTPLHQAVGGGHKDIVSLLLNEGCPINAVDSGGRNILHFAAGCGQIHMIEMLAEQGLDVNMGDNEGCTPLHYAAVYGQRESVRTLLRLGSRESMSKVAGTGGTPLHQAVGKGHKDIVSLLLNEGCPNNVVDSEDRSVLHYAAGCGQIHMIEMFAEQGLDVNIGDDEGRTPLHAATVSGQLESVRTLLRLGGRESMTKVAGTRGTPLHQAVGRGHKDIVSLLLNEACPINVVDSEGRSALHFAGHFGHVHMIEMLAEQGLDVNKGDDEGQTALHYAATYGQLKSLHKLLRLGGGKSMTKVAGTYGTPLHRAVARGHKDIVSLLLNEGCPTNVVDSKGRHVLHYAARYGQINMMGMLAEQGLDVNIGDNNGWTPLHAAAACGQLKSVRTLLRLGGRESMTRVVGTHGSPLHQAVAGGHKDIMSLLLSEGCPIDIADSEGASVLHFAAQYGRFHLISMLADQGLDVNIGDNQGCTPLHYAAGRGQVTTFKELVSVGGNIHLMDKFGMKFSDLILLSQSFVTMKQFCVACDLECDNEGLLGVISALSANNLLDMNRILSLAAVFGNISIFDAMVTSPYPLYEQKMPMIAKILSFLSGGKKLPDQFHVWEEPLNPLHISILSEYLSFSENIKFIKKLTSHPRTRYTINEFFPNGLSPVDVARQFELHDIAEIIESAGGGPGVWADLPRELQDKAISHFVSLKELRGGELGEKATSKILSILGYQVVEGEGLYDAKRKCLKERPVLHLLEQILLHIKSKGKWKRVGRLLKVDENTLKRLSEEATDDDDAFYSMLEHWSKNGRHVSWKTLLDAVGHFETKKTVDDITDMIVEELAPSQVSIQMGSFHFNYKTFVVQHIYTTT